MSLTKLSLFECKKALASDEITSEELTSAYIKRINEKNGEICAFLNFDGNSPHIMAKNIDRMRVGRNSSPLFGIPYAIKDNISVKDMRTTAGSMFLKNYIPPYSATVVEKLSLSPILGKTNMDEFGMGSTTEKSAFFPTKNPIDTSLSPGGSSGGSAAAVAAGMAPFALGSDTGGSVRQPAAFCGIVGMKPTYGLVSRHGLIAFASSFDCIGPMTRTVRENALVLSEISGKDEFDATSEESESDFISEIDSGVKGLKIGIWRDFGTFEHGRKAKDNLSLAAEKLALEGAFVEDISIPFAEEILSAYYILSSAEASSNLGRYDGIRFGERSFEYSSLEELIKKSRSEGFGKEVKRRIMLGTFVLSEGSYGEYYSRALQIRNKTITHFNRLFREYDLIMTLTSPSSPPKLGEKRDVVSVYSEDILTVPANMASLPALSVPFEKNEDNTKTGIQLIGKKFSEATLYKVGVILEEAAK